MGELAWVIIHGIHEKAHASVAPNRGRIQWPVRHPVDQEAAGPAHPLPTVRLEDHRLPAVLNDLVVEAVEPFLPIIL